MWTNNSIKASEHVFIKLTKYFQIRMSLNLACLAQTVKFLVANIGAILFDNDNNNNIFNKAPLLSGAIQMRYLNNK